MSKEMKIVSRGKMDDAVTNFFDDLLAEATENEMLFGEYINTKFPREDDKEPEDAIQFYLESKGIVLQDRAYAPSTRLNQFDLKNLETTDHVPTRMLHEYTTNLASKAMETVRIDERTISLSSLDRKRLPWQDEFIDTVQSSVERAPSLSWNELARSVRRIREDSYLLPKRENPASERGWEIVLEDSGEPRFQTVSHSTSQAEFDIYRKAFRLTYDWLNSNQTRIQDYNEIVMEAMTELAITLLVRFAKAIHDAVPATGATTALSGNDAMGVAHASGRITVAEWDEVDMDFGSVYRPTRVIGNQQSIRAFRAMAIQSGNQFLMAGDARVNNANLIPPFASMNIGPGPVRYGWATGVSELGNNELIAWDHTQGLDVFYKIGGDQDATVDNPAERAVERYLTVQVANNFYRPDGAIRRVTF